MVPVVVSCDPNPSREGWVTRALTNQARTSHETTITQRANCAGELLSSAPYLSQGHGQAWGLGLESRPDQDWEGLESRAAHPGSPNEVIARAVLSACQHNSPAASSPSARADQVSPRPTTLISRSRPATLPPTAASSLACPRLRLRDDRLHSACHSPERSGSVALTEPLNQLVRRTSARKSESCRASS